MDLEKYKALFIEESREHLGAVSRLLVEVESAADPGATIDEIFRHVHSVKGMAASMGYDATTAVAHAMEDAVDVFRKGKRGIPAPVLDHLLQGVDALLDHVRRVEANEEVPAPADLVAGIAKSARAARTTEPAPPRPARAVSLAVHIDEGAASPAVRAFLVLKQLASLGRVASSMPTAEALKAGELPNHTLHAVLETELSEQEVQATLAKMPDVSAVVMGSAPREEPAPRTPPAPTPPVEPEAKAAPTVRVRTDILDGLIDTVGELFIVRERIQSVASAQNNPELRAALDALATRVREIHQQVMTVRMMPMRVVLERFPRLVRDVARSLGKEVELEIQGADIELDRAVLDHLDAPFIHTLRNAVDHGIETAEDRQRAQKPAVGKIVIMAMRDRDTVVVTISDDGRGLNAEALRKAAVDRGLLTQAQAAVLSTREAHFLICLPGFSTKEEVSDLSGRGVGMDAVRTKVESVGGTLDIESELGHGTRFVFRLPLTLAIIPVLLVRTAARTFAIPVAKVVAVREEGDEDELIRQAGGGRYLSFEHALVPVHDLAALLQLPATEAPKQLVITEDGRDLSALAVERILGYHEVVVKPLGDPLDRLEWFSGATILGDGMPILILDLPKALRLRQAA